MAMSIPREERDAGNIRKVEEVGFLNGGAIIHSSLQQIRQRRGVKQRDTERQRERERSDVAQGVLHIKRKMSTEFPQLDSCPKGPQFGRVLYFVCCSRCN